MFYWKILLLTWAGSLRADKGEMNGKVPLGERDRKGWVDLYGSAVRRDGLLSIYIFVYECC